MYHWNTGKENYTADLILYASVLNELECFKYGGST